MSLLNKNIIIETERLLLRYFSMGDVEKVYELSKEEGIHKWLPEEAYEDKQQAEDVVKSLIDNYSGNLRPRENPFILGVELNHTSELIGHVGLNPYEDGVEVCYAIGEKHQGKGYATEAVSEISTWAIKELGLFQIIGKVRSENKKSCRVLEKSGYKLIEAKVMFAFRKECVCRIYCFEGNSIA